MIEQKKNDWLATLFLSPDKSVQDLANLGINTDNSSIQNIDYYKKIPQIQEAFKKNDGTFDDSSFKKYYDGVLTLYNEADRANLSANIMDFYDYDPVDYFAPVGGNVRDVAPKIVQFANPFRQSRGLEGFNEISAPTMSIREVAQTNKVFNVETNKFEDWTPNDWGGLSAITRPTLVLAQWDTDGVHEVNGRQVKHKAGDYKFNEDGDPFYETLGNRSAAGKEILHIEDTLTIDGNKWNKYDAFDSDGLDKNIGSTVAKTVLKLAPALIPGVGIYYGGFTAALEIGKLLPMLYKSVAGIAAGDLSGSKSAQVADDMYAWFSRFDSSLSDKGKASFLNWENIGQIVGDSSKQLFQQRAIGAIPGWLAKMQNKPISENTLKWGRGLSLAYMAGTSSVDTFDAFKAAGASDRVAGLGMISSMGAMYSLMNTDYFKDFWFKGTYLDRGQSRAAIKKLAEESKKSFQNKAIDSADPVTTAKWVKGLSKKFENLFVKIKNSDIISGSINEGIEETAEEISMDMVKGFYSALNHLGIIDNNQEYNFGMSIQDMLSRYAASAIGGAIGGAVFSAQSKFENSFYDKGPKDRWDQIKEMGGAFGEIVYLYRQGRGEELKKELERYYRNGKLGSANLSGLKYKLVKDDKGVSKIQYEGANESDSQNDIAYKQISEFFDWIEDTMTEEGLKITDDELDKWIAYSKEADPDLDLSKLGREGIRKLLVEDTIYNQAQIILGKGISSQIYSDWNNLTEKIITTKAEMEKMFSPKEGEKSESKDFEDKKKALEKNPEYQNLKETLKSLREQRDEILRGEKNDYYFGQWRFAVTDSLAKLFVNGFGLHNYAKYFHGKNWDEIESDDVRRSIKEEYENFSKLNEKQQILKAYDMFSTLQEKFGSKFLEIAKKSKDSSEIFKNSTLYEDQIGWLDLQIKLLEHQKLNANGEDVEKLEKRIEGFKNQKKEIESNPLQIFTPSLTEKGEALLQRPDNIFDSNKQNLYFSSYLDLLRKSVDDGFYMDKIDADLINIGRTYVSKFLNGNNPSDLVKTIYSKFNEFFMNQSDPRFIFDDLFEEDSWNVFIRPIVEMFYELTRGDFKEALKKYNEIKSQQPLTIFEEDWDLVINALDKILPDFIDDQSELNIQKKGFIQYLNEVIDLKSKIRKSPVYELLSELETFFGRDGEEIVRLIENEFDNFMNSPTTEDYIIQNKSNLERLKEVSGLLMALESLVIAAGGSYNIDLNKYRSKLGKELFPEIDQDLKQVMDSDILTLKNKLDTLLEIVEANGEKSLRKQQEIEENMRKKFIFLLAGNTDLSKSFSEIFDFDLDDIFNAIGVDRNNLENYGIEELHSIGVKLETEIYKVISSKNLSVETIVEKLFDKKLFDGNVLIKGETTKLNSDPNQQITQFDQLMYLASIISTPSQNFELKLKELLEKGEIEKAPIFSQVYATKLAYANIKNPKLFNKILWKLKEVAKHNPEDYLKTKSVFSNMIFISGGAGVGKSTGVGSLLNKMLEGSYELVTCAPSEDQVSNLNTAIKSKNSHKSLTKDKLIESIIGTQISTKELANNDHVRIITDSNGKRIGYTLKSVTIKNNDVFTENQTRILVIDEIGVFNKIELEIISQWASKNNIIVVGLGDYKQNGGTLIIDGVHNPTSIEDGFIVKSPELTASLRVQNVAQSDNYILLSTVLGNIYDYYYAHPELDETELSSYVNEYLSKNRLKLKYFNQNGFFAGGTKIITQDDVETYVKELSKLGNVAIISNDVDKYSILKSDKVSVWTPYDVQGREFDYVIIDKDLPVSFLDRLKDIYTLSQRAKKGSIFALNKDNGLFSSVESESTSGNIQVTESQIENYKKWKLQLMSGISGETVEEKTLKESESKPTTPSKDEDDEGNEGSKSSDQSNPNQTKTEETQNVQDQTNVEQSREITPTIDNSTTTSYVPDNSTVDFSPSIKPIQSEKPKDKFDKVVISSGSENRKMADEMFKASEIKILSDLRESTKLWTDYFVDENGVSLFTNQTFDPRQIWNHVRAYFLYKHNLDSDFQWPAKCEKFFRTNKRNNLIKLSKFLNESSSYRVECLEFGGNSKHYICKVFEIEGIKYVLPLIVAPDMLNTPGDFNFDFRIKNDKNTFVSKKPGSSNFIEFSENDIYESDCMIHNNPVILVEPKENQETLEQKLQSESISDSEKQNIKWRLNNNGNSFIVVSSDPLVTETDFQNFLQFGNEGFATQETLRSPFRILALNSYVEDLKTLMKMCDDDKSASKIISTSQIGRVIGSIYVKGDEDVKIQFKNWIDERVLSWINWMLDKKYYNGIFRIKVSFRQNDIKDVDQFSESFEYDFTRENMSSQNLFEAINNKLKEYSDIKFEFYYSKNGSDFEKVEVSGSNIFGNDKAHYSLMKRIQPYVSKLDETLRELQKYKYGIALNDKIYSESERNKIEGGNWFYVRIESDRKYTSRNISAYNGCDFEILINKNIGSDQDEQVCDQYNKFLEEQGIIGVNGLSNRRITSLNTLSQIINDINEDIRQQTSSPTFKQIGLNGNTIRVETVTDYEQLLRNYLRSEGQEVIEISQNSIDGINGLKYQKFVVSLSDKTIEYIWDEGWKTNEKYLNEHIELQQAINSIPVENDNVRELVKIFEQFGNGIVFDLKLSREFINTYKQAVMNNYFNEIKTIINNLLLKKLENGEC